MRSPATKLVLCWQPLRRDGMTGPPGPSATLRTLWAQERAGGPRAWLEESQKSSPSKELMPSGPQG